MNMDFRKKADELFKDIVNFVDYISDDEIDLNVTDNIIEIHYGEKIFIINKQYQIEEVWLSSPLSGPYHFKHLNNSWVNRDNINFLELIKKELLMLVRA